MSLSPSPQLPSEKRFGLLFTFVFASLAGVGHFKNWNQTWIAILIGFSVLLAFLTLVAPKTLSPFNWAWFMLGQLMGRVVSPIVLGAIFFLILTPVGLITRVFGRDELRLKRKSVDSYWIIRKNNIDPTQSFKNQF